MNLPHQIIRSCAALCMLGLSVAHASPEQAQLQAAIQSFGVSERVAADAATTAQRIAEQQAAERLAKVEPQPMPAHLLLDLGW